MTTSHDRLGISPTATPDEVKAAYHNKLREFPAHSHPDDFKAIRAAYEAIRKGETTSGDDFLAIRPLKATLDPALVKQLEEKVMAQVEVNLETLIKLTF